MIISNMSLDKCRDVILKITPLVGHIFRDFIALDEANKNVDTDNDTQVAIANVSYIENLIDLLFSKHFESLLQLLSDIYDINVSEIKNKSIDDLTQMADDVLTDKVLLRFFPQLRQLAKKTQ